MEAIMPRIGLRDLKTRASEVVRDVQCNQERYTITNRGVPVAVIVPYAQREETRPLAPVEMTARLDGLAGEISAQWSDARPVAELIDELRR
jgi:prevent-host-death family protein